jgi:ribosomal-protein-alanine N-acetyltransferase
VIITETENLVLRELGPLDAEELFRIYSNPENMRFLGQGPDSLDEERQNIQRHIDSYYRVHGFGLWGVVLKSEDRLIGRCGILKQEVDGRTRPEISYLIDRDHCGRGLATEAARGVLDIAAGKYGIDKIIAVIASGNGGSMRVAEKCGFQFEKRLSMFKDFGPVVVYSRDLVGEKVTDRSG